MVVGDGFQLGLVGPGAVRGNGRRLQFAVLLGVGVVGPGGRGTVAMHAGAAYWGARWALNDLATHDCVCEGG